MTDSADERQSGAKKRARLFFDVTFTRTQKGNVGITRTVRRLIEECEVLSDAYELDCIPVAFNSAGFRVLPGGWRAALGDVRPDREPTSRGLLQWLLDTTSVRQFVSRRFPLMLRRLAWSVYSHLEFNRLSATLPPAEFETGDILFLCDASWSYRVWKAASLAQRHGAKVITVVYDLIPIRQPQYCTPLTTLVFRQWVRRQIPRSDALLCISRAVERDLHLFAAQAGTKLPRTAVFRLGCDPAPAVFGQVRTEIRTFVTGGSPCFVAVGSFEPRKNYELLVDAFRRLWAEGVDARLLLMGRRAEHCRPLLETIDRLRERERRLFAVFDANDAEVDFAYANGSALVFPSLAEGFGLPLVEARTRGCLVIASDLPVFAELADDGVAIFPSGSISALQELVRRHIEDDKRTRTPPMAAHTWSASARECLTLIRQL